MRKNEKYFLEKWYSKEEIDNHYKVIKINNDKNKEKRNNLEKEFSKELEKLKEIKSIKINYVSLLWDGVYIKTKYLDSVFIDFYDINNNFELLKQVYNY
jgi:hypothetical protein